MRNKKTPQSKRTTYNYTYYDSNGKKEKEVILRAGKDGVTENDIANLHKLDDSELHNNRKNSQPPKTKHDKIAISNWKKIHISEDEPINSNVSIDYCAEHQEMDDARKVLSALSYSDKELSEDIMRLRELVETLDPIDKKIYDLVILNEMTYESVAKKLNTCVSDIHYHLKKIKKYIKDNF